MKSIRVRNKNALLELLEGKVPFEKIAIMRDLDRDALTERIVHAATHRGIPIEETPRGHMDVSRSGNSHEAIVGYASPPRYWTLDTLLPKLYEEDSTPFFVLMHNVGYENNVGSIARTAYAAGVNGIIVQPGEERYVTDESVHISLGTLLRIPLVSVSTFEALKELDRNGIPSYALHMHGTPYTNASLNGPVAFVLGAEGEGLSDTVLKHVTKPLSIPMQEGIESLNVSASAAIVLFEKVRQEGPTFLR